MIGQFPTFRPAMTIALVLLMLTLSLQAGPAKAASPVYAHTGGTCAGLTPCYTTIQEAVDNVDVGGTVRVFPGTYVESVSFGSMGTLGDITLVTVDSSGAATAGTATVTPASGPSFYHSIAAFPGSVTIDGFNISSPDDLVIDLWSDGHDLVLANLTSTGGDGINVDGTANTTISDSSSNDSSASGFNIFATSTITVEDSSADDNFTHGFELDGGTVNIAGSSASSNGSAGFSVLSSGMVTMTNSTANNNDTAFDVTGDAGVTMTGLVAMNNGNEGIHPHSNGPVVVKDSFASGIADDGIDVETSGDVTIMNSTSTLSGDDGVQIDSGGDVVIDGLTSTNNGQHPEGDGDGVEINSYAGGDPDVQSVSITNSLFTGNNDQAIDFDDPFFNTAGTYAATSNIICQNQDGYNSDSNVSVDGTGNWWGTASGPIHPNNPGGTGDAVRDSATGSFGTFNYDPWIDTITGSGGPAVQGQPVAVTFEFTDTSVALMDGPGDQSGDRVFAASTDNGMVSTSGFLSGGKLEVTLTPETVGTATVTVTGPCGLDGTLGGNSVVLDVAAAPTPAATPAELPDTGGSPSTSGNGWILALVAAAAGIAIVGAMGGVATVRRRG